MQYTPGPGVDPQLRAAYRLDPDGTPVFVGGYADPATQTLTADLTHFSRDVVLQVQPRFTDVTGGWATHGVAVAAAHLIIVGVGPTTFAPSLILNRASFVTMLTRVLGLPPLSGGTAFRDVPAGAWYAGAVAAAVRAGLVRGTTADIFSPSQPLTREQMALLLQRAAAYSGRKASLQPADERSALRTYADASAIDGVGVPGHAYAVSTGLIRGEPGQVLRPAATATRPQAAAVLARFLFRGAGH